MGYCLIFPVAKEVLQSFSNPTKHLSEEFAKQVENRFITNSKFLFSKDFRISEEVFKVS